MRRNFLPKIRLGINVLVMVCIAAISKANLVGAEMQYSLLNDSVLVTVSVYDNYSGNFNMSPYVKLRHSNSSSSKTGLLKLISKTDVTPKCANGCSKFTSATCSNDFTLVRLTYQTTFAFENFSSGDCDMVLTWQSCCRPHTSRPFFLQSTFNRCVENGNTSPVFSKAPMVIASQFQHYSNFWSAVDSDGDSLRYELAPAYINNSEVYDYGKDLDYTGPLKYLGYPEKSSTKYPRGFHLNKFTGLLRFYPTTESSAPVVVKVSEYRGGVKIGQIVRDVTMTVQRVTNRKPVISGINGTSKETINACVGQEVCFSIVPRDLDSRDNLTLTWTSDIPDAKITTKSGRRPELDFCWTPKGKDLNKGTFRLNLRVSDNSCDLKGLFEKTITINIRRPFEASYVPSISGCQEISLLSKTKGLGSEKVSYLWEVGDEEYTTKNITLSYDKEGTPTAKLTVTNEETGCKDEYASSFTVPAKPVVLTDESISTCVENPVELSASGGTSVKWMDAQRKVLSEHGEFSTMVTSPTSFIVQVEDEYGCRDEKTVSVDIIEPQIELFQRDDQDEAVAIVCQDNSIWFEATGAHEAAYEWSKGGLVNPQTDKAEYKFKRSSIVSVSTTDKNGCYGTVSFPVTVDNDCVWPGDIDGDEEVNNIDVLYVGLAYNEQSSPVRKPVSNEWKSFHAENWAGEFIQSAGTRNYKHADTNGDGIIDFLDLNAIDVFYKKEYKTNKKKTEKGAQLKFVHEVDSLKNNKRVHKVSVHLGDQKSVARNVYGIAFSIDYQASVKASSVVFDTDDSWITKGSNKIQLVKNLPEYNTEDEIVGGKIDVAISRTDKVSVSGAGKVGLLKFVIEDDIDWKNLNEISLDFLGVHLIDNEGKPIDAYGVNSVISLNPTSIGEGTFGEGINVFPNPTSNGHLTLSINEEASTINASIVSITGQEVMRIPNLTSGINHIDVTNLQGYYFIRVVSEEGLSKSIPVVIK